MLPLLVLLLLLLIIPSQVTEQPTEAVLKQLLAMAMVMAILNTSRHHKLRTDLYPPPLLNLHLSLLASRLLQQQQRSEASCLES